MKNSTWEQFGFAFIDRLRLPVLLFLGVSLLTYKPPSAMLIRHDINPDAYIVNEADYPAVFPLFEDENIKECVATLIDPNWAITAAHCLVLLYENDFLESGYRVNIAGVENTINQIVWPEELGTLDAITSDENDLEEFDPYVKDATYDTALIELHDVVEHVTPIALYEGSDEVGKTILLLGWGDFGTGDVGLPPEPINDRQFRQATNQITATEANYLFFEFDDPVSGNALLLEGVNGPGDSGGPALVETDSGLQIIGVSSGGEYKTEEENELKPQGQYGWQEFYIRVSQMRSWINRIIHPTD
ncbi:MAG: trypsin-like serine protease [Cyanobacteria bacterium J06626_18]